MRNHRCPQYSRCLDRTIAHDRADFDCSGCPHRHDTDDIDPQELTGCALLRLARRFSLGRRNLHPNVLSTIRGRIYGRAKKKVTNPEGIGGKSGKIDDAQNEQQQPTDTADKIASQTGVSRATVVRDAKIAKAIDLVVVAEWCELVGGEKPRQADAVLGGRGNEGGQRHAARELGLSEPDVHRARKVAGALVALVGALVTTWAVCGIWGGL